VENGSLSGIMYKILLFSGGVYKFDHLQEHVDDVGGILIKEDRLQIIRGSSFLSEEVRVTVVLPQKEVNSLKSLASEIKGEIEELEIEKDHEKGLLSYLKLYNILSRADSWLTPEDMEELIKCPCHDNICSEEDQCLLDGLEEILEKLFYMDLLEMREIDGKKEYRIYREDF
jgi:hypothetical protein